MHCAKTTFHIQIIPFSMMVENMAIFFCSLYAVVDFVSQLSTTFILKLRDIIMHV